MSVLRVALVLCAALPALALAQDVFSLTSPEAIAQPEPIYPTVEINRGREGWVLVDCTVSGDGVVTEAKILDSSGSQAFDKVTLDAIRKWHYETMPGETELTVLVNFEFRQQLPQLSRRFVSLYRKAHKAIDNGELDKAQKLVDKMRSDDKLTAVELAYTNVTDGRIAGQRGDSAGQLERFRKALLNDGRWVDAPTHRYLLYAAVVLAMQQEDYASAIHDYELLTRSPAGREVAADLEEPMRAIMAKADGSASIPSPFMTPDLQVTVKHERPALGAMPRRDRGHWSMNDTERSYQRMKESQDAARE